MYIQEKIEDMKARFDKSGELSISDKTFIESHYERVLNKPFTRSGCGQCYRDAFIEMYLHIKKYGIMNKGSYILKREEVIHIAGDPQVYTRANMTDAVAIKYLKKYPNAISRFESYPEDWQSIQDKPEVKKKRTRKEK